MSASHRKRRSLSPPLPREHGTWAMLFAPLAIGLAAGHPDPRAAAFLVIAATAAFLAQAEARAIPKSELARPGAPAHPGPHTMWTCVYGGISLGAGLALILVFRHLELLWLAALVAAAFALEASRTRIRAARAAFPRTAREFLAAAVFSLAAPAGAAVSRGRLDREGAILWTLCALYFASSVFTVRTWIEGARLARLSEAGRRGPDERGGSARLGRGIVVYHLLLAACLVITVISGPGSPVRWWTAAAFAPAIARALNAWWRAGTARPTLKAVGTSELVFVLAFTACILVAESLARTR